MLAIRPNILGEFASYNRKTVAVNSTQRPILFLDKTSIKYYSVVPDTSKKYSFLLNMLTGTINTSDGTQYLSQEGIILNKLTRTALFEQVRPPKVANVDKLQISDIDSNESITVVGFHTSNKGLG